jgi:hypothetical protein
MSYALNDYEWTAIKPMLPERGSGTRECWIPVSLAPPDRRRPRILRANSRAIRPGNSSDFSFVVRTPARQGRAIVLRRARFSPKL